MKYANISLFAALAFTLVVSTAQAGSVDVFDDHAGKFTFTLNPTDIEDGFDTFELVIDGLMN